MFEVDFSQLLRQTGQNQYLYEIRLNQSILITTQQVVFNVFNQANFKALKFIVIKNGSDTFDECLFK